MYSFSPLQFALETFAIPLVCVTTIALVWALGARLFCKVPFWQVLFYYGGFGIPVGAVAYGAGVLTGLSRSPAVGSVMPAVLAMIAGLSVYVFGTENRYKVLVGYSVSVLIFMLFFGIETGALNREEQREAYLLSISQIEF